MPGIFHAALNDYAHSAYPMHRIHFFCAETQSKSRAWIIWSGSYAMYIRADPFCFQKLCEQAFIHSFHRVIHSIPVHQPKYSEGFQSLERLLRDTTHKYY